jgi:hypothetical protein
LDGEGILGKESGVWLARDAFAHKLVQVRQPYPAHPLGLGSWGSRYGFIWPREMRLLRALKEYRQKTGIPARQVVVGMTTTGFSIADPNDGGMMDVVGFDQTTPRAVEEFVVGGFS